MADIFQEVEEDLKRERTEQLLKRLAPYLTTLIVVVLLATAGWTWYQRNRAQVQAQQASRYSAALRLIAGENADAAADVLTDFAKEADAGYATLARLVAAGVRAEKGDAPAAIALLEAVANDAKADKLLRDVALLRALALRLDLDPPAEILAKLAPLQAADAPFRFSAREIAALAQIKAGNLPAAREGLQALADDLTAPAALRARATELLATLTATAAR